ncbi:histidine phosphatase family protein [Paenibacillus sp. IHBB 10380]|uniref:histidine phosphatase family protein n=1 Tax=Paenibacillus sp. IHBB 10380 TaxID=1566358 RepID=UPI0005CF95A5|nr:histidine phosphatase family protein [Paenibacillus sp. IHBB 10380]AJS58974.1 phosphoglycerate mutase [Paenibacillus sp. IHBB 10380]
MTTFIYFVRHAESIYVEGTERSRSLSEKGMADALAIKDILKTEEIDYFISSPYERSIETIRPMAIEYLKDIKIEEDLRERNIGEFSSISFKEAKCQVYEDIHYAFPQGESNLKAQKRSVKVMEDILETYEGKKIVIGTHGDIMTLMMNHFDKQYGFDFWESTSMPDIYKLRFEEKRLISTIRLWGSSLEEGNGIS